MIPEAVHRHGPCFEVDSEKEEEQVGPTSNPKGRRSSRRLTVSLLACTLVGLIRCGDDSDSLSYEEYAEESAAVNCSYFAKCCNDSENPMKDKTEAECQASLMKQAMEIADTPGFEWDPEGKAGCLAILSKLEDCIPRFPVSFEMVGKIECRPPNTKLVGAMGDKCGDIGTLCQPGLLCLYTPGQSREGTCQAPRTDGSECSADYECASGICSEGACASSGSHICDGK